MGLKAWIIPQERQFFDLLERLAPTVDEGGSPPADLLHQLRGAPMQCPRIQDGEHHRDENVADDLMNNAVAALFREEDPVTIIKFKEITEVLEQATDHCEDVANVLSDIVAKNQ